MQRKRKILLWAPLGAGTHYWGPGTSAFRLFSSASDDVEISLVHGYPGQERHDLFSESVCLGDLRKLNLLNLSRFLYNGMRWLSQNAYKYDLFLGLTAYEYTVRPAFHAEKLGLPTVTKITGLRSGLEASTGVRRILGFGKRRRLMLRQCSAVVAISNDIALKLREFGFDESQIWQIPNGVDTKRFCGVGDREEKTRIRKRLGLPDRFTILFVGGMSSRKQPSRNVELLKDLRDLGNKNIQAVFVGPQREENYLDRFQRQIVELNLQDSVFWRDHVDDVALYYKAGDVFVLLSRHEGMSNALLEALASGLPAIVTDVSGSRELVVSGQNGEIVSDRGNLDAVNVVQRYCDDYSEYIRQSRAARNHILSGFSYEIVWKELRRRIDALIDSGNRFS